MILHRPAVRTHIRDRQFHQLDNEIQTGAKFQMQSMDSSLVSLCQTGAISLETALSNARNIDFIRRHASSKP